MNKIIGFLPLTTAPFQMLAPDLKRNYFVIKANDNCALKGLKHIGNAATKVVIVLALTIIALATPILLFSDGINLIVRKIQAKKQEGDFHYLFSSKIFSSYIKQLKAHVSQELDAKPSLKAISLTYPLQKSTAELIQLILTTTESTNEDRNRNFHQQLVVKLRNVIEEKKGVQESELNEFVDFIDNLSAFIYTGTNLLPEISQFLAKHLPNSVTSVEPLSIPGWIHSWHAKSIHSSKFRGIFEPVPARLYDPRMLGDVPTMLYEYPLANRNVKMIRTPTIVKDMRRNAQGVDQAEVVKEFHGFLDSYKKQNKVHLYVNLMDRKYRSEATRSNCIESLEKEYPQNLKVISLSKDSPFYRQSENFNVPSMSYVNFKHNFLNEMFDQTVHFRWSPALGSDWQKKCAAALDNVHSRHFQNRTQLSLAERKDFIEIAYTEIVEAAMETLNPDSCNISCLSCIDRAAAMLTEQFIKVCKKAGNDLSADQKRTIATISLAPAILAQNRLMLQERMDRFHTAATRMLA